jgi:Tat protein secretion system quality control protein TatD with DNase activity
MEKPIVIHSRDAETDTLRVLQEEVLDKGRASHPIHMHCFSGSKAFTDALLTAYPGRPSSSDNYLNMSSNLW